MRWNCGSLNLCVLADDSCEPWKLLLPSLGIRAKQWRACSRGCLDGALQLSQCCTDSSLYLELDPTGAIVKQLSVLKLYSVCVQSACVCRGGESRSRDQMSAKKQFLFFD